jgi:hypothetical protein
LPTKHPFVIIARIPANPSPDVPPASIIKDDLIVRKDIKAPKHLISWEISHDIDANSAAIFEYWGECKNVIAFPANCQPKELAIPEEKLTVTGINAVSPEDHVL